MSKLLNDYFLSVFTRENQDTIPVGEVFQGEDNEKLRDVIITRQVVQKEIEKLKKNKSQGPDKIYPRMLKECKEILSGPLTNVTDWTTAQGKHLCPPLENSEPWMTSWDTQI